MSDSYTIEYYFRGSSRPHSHTVYCTEKDARGIASKYFKINTVRLVTVYSEHRGFIMSIGG